MAENKLGHGAVILTGNQTSGRGQRGNSWESEPGKNLTLSAVIKPSFLPVSRQFELNVMTSLALIKTLQDAGLRNSRIKWPNDIFVGDRKIAGILIENIVRSNQLDWAILGVGLNVNQAVFDVSGATSIKLELDCEQSLDLTLDHLLKALNIYYNLLASGKLKVLRDLYTSYLMWIDEKRIFRDTGRNIKFEGVIAGVNADGRLVVRSKRKELAFDYKQIAFIS